MEKENNERKKEKGEKGRNEEKENENLPKIETRKFTFDAELLESCVAGSLLA